MPAYCICIDNGVSCKHHEGSGCKFLSGDCVPIEMQVPSQSSRVLLVVPIENCHAPQLEQHVVFFHGNDWHKSIS